MFFFFNDTATTEIYTLSLHDALPILLKQKSGPWPTYSAGTIPCHTIESKGRMTRPTPSIAPIEAARRDRAAHCQSPFHPPPDRKSTRLNSSHANISYAVFCLKKKNK